MEENGLRDEVGARNYDLVINNGYDPEELLFFVNPCFDGALIGVSDSGHLIYDYDKMVEAAMEEEGWTEEEARDWIDYNSIRSLPYVDCAPVVMYRLYED